MQTKENKMKFENLNRKQYFVGRYKLPSFFATCNTNEDNMSTIYLINFSFSRFVIDFCISKSQNTCHSLNAFFTQVQHDCMFSNLLCSYSIFFLSIFRKWNFNNGSLIKDSHSTPSKVLDLEATCSYLLWSTKLETTTSWL